jgi:hypothetical protein
MDTRRAGSPSGRLRGAMTLEWQARRSRCAEFLALLGHEAGVVVDVH